MSKLAKLDPTLRPDVEREHRSPPTTARPPDDGAPQAGASLDPAMSSPD
jgi:hypothetical protein